MGRSDSVSVDPRAGFRHALIRRIPDSFAPFYRDRDIRIDPATAAAEQAAYAAALETAGLRIEWAEAAEAFPDCVFLEDTFVLGAGGAGETTNIFFSLN